MTTCRILIHMAHFYNFLTFTVFSEFSSSGDEMAALVERDQNLKKKGEKQYQILSLTSFSLPTPMPKPTKHFDERE